ncbi:DUF3397 family protein [Sporosarcina sp. G11-34]|uniref:DUF3397 family protein n=1 Tax=Sporosarcina sp. G11-34 TaxID=2849605 RepID=UPI0022A925E5|nr:DUF3397 family protein [Sporosarcina sp. G11-34]MCZ2258880.1 DUF3397 domain-containing protein [Sporosarcina sp. G11-34]
MSTFISVLVGVLIACPFFVTIALLFFFRRKGKSPAKVIGFAADVTTPFLFLAIYIISRSIFEIEVGFYIAIIAVILAIVYAVIERTKRKEFQVVQFLRKTWRLFFLTLAMAYIVLLVLGVVLKIIDYVY